MLKLKSALITLILTFTSSLFAETNLSAEVIEQWIASQKALEEWGHKHEETLTQYEEQADQGENPFLIEAETMIAPLKASGLHTQAENLIKKYGFESMLSWAETTLTITKAAAAIEFENSPEMFDADKLRAILNSGNLNEQQKAMLEQAIAHNQAMVESLKAIDQEDKDAVRPYLEKIASLMDNQE